MNDALLLPEKKILKLFPKKINKLVDGFNPFEKKNISQIGNLHQIGMKKKNV